MGIALPVTTKEVDLQTTRSISPSLGSQAMKLDDPQSGAFKRKGILEGGSRLKDGAW